MQQSKPNIIFLMSDQMAQSVIMPSSQCIMPNVQELRKDGVLCTHSYSSNAVCSPARASLMTGMLPHNHGMVDVTHAVPKYRADYDSSLDTFSNVLKDSGYHNGYFGKWHVERTHKLENFGYDEYLTERDIPAMHITAIEKTMLPGFRTGYDDKVVGGIYSEGPESSEEFFIFQKARDFIDRSSKNGNPFCAFISTYAPHDPYSVPKAVYDLYEGVDISLPDNFEDMMLDKPNIYQRMRKVWESMSVGDVKKIRRYYFSYCTLVDMQIGELVRYLKDNELYDNTLIVLISDHGDLQGAHGLFCKGVPAFEEAYKIPLIFKFPKQQYGNTVCNGYVSTCDVAPTVLEIAGTIPLRNRTDGKSVVDLLSGKKSGEGTYCLAEFFGQRYAFTQRLVWKDDFKYVFNGFDWDELYDLNSDPAELVNQINNPDYQPKVKELAELMQEIVLETEDSTMNETQYYTTRIAPVGPKKGKKMSEYGVYNKLF